MWLTCDCNFFIKLISFLVLIFAIIVNGIGNFIGIGDIIDTTVHSCYTTQQSTTLEATEESSKTEVVTTKKQTTAVATSSISETTTAVSQSTTVASTTAGTKKTIPQPAVELFDELLCVLVIPPDVEGCEVGLEIEPYAEYVDMGDGQTGFIELTAGTTYSITAEAVVDGEKLSSEPIVVTVRTPISEKKVILDTVTYNSISVNPDNECEYSLYRYGYGTIRLWGNATEFTDLAPDTEYRVDVRYKKTEFHSTASETVSLNVKTLSEPTTTAVSVPSTEKPTTTLPPSTNPTTTRPTTSTTKPITTQGGPHISAAEQVSLSIFGGGTGLNIGTVVKGMDSFPDGSYVACGTTASVNGDFSGLYDDSYDWKTPFSFIAKFTRSGELEWVKLFGDSSASVYLNDIAVLDNGKIAAVGSFEIPTSSAKVGSIDAVIYTVSSKGAQLSRKLLEGTGDDILYCIEATSNGFVVGGKTTSTDGAFDGVPGMSSIVLNYDLEGNILWKRYFNASKSSRIADIAVDEENSIFLSCITTATDGQFSAFEGLIGSYADTVILKYTYSGDYIWHHVIATTGTDEFDSIAADGKGGCLVAGNYTLVSSTVTDGTLEGIHNCGGTDALIFRIDKNGERLWYKILSGFYDDFITDIVRTSGGFAVTGYSESSNREFSSVGNSGETDGFVCFCNINGNKIKLLSQGGSRDDAALCLAYSKSQNEVLAVGRTVSSDGVFAENTFGNSIVGYIARFKFTVG